MVHRNEVKSLSVVQDFRITVPVSISNNIVRNIPQCQRHFVRLSLLQHFDEIVLRINIHKQKSLVDHNQSSTEIIYGSTFTNTPF